MKQVTTGYSSVMMMVGLAPGNPKASPCSGAAAPPDPYDKACPKCEKAKKLPPIPKEDAEKIKPPPKPAEPTPDPVPAEEGSTDKVCDCPVSPLFFSFLPSFSFLSSPLFLISFLYPTVFCNLYPIFFVSSKCFFVKPNVLITPPLAATGLRSSQRAKTRTTP